MKGRRVDQRPFMVRRFDARATPDGFDTSFMEAYYHATALEAASCWPLVLAGKMTNARFHERIVRLLAAMERRVEGMIDEEGKWTSSFQKPSV